MNSEFLLIVDNRTVDELSEVSTILLLVFMKDIPAAYFNYN
jgi:hypothetical protein